MILVNVISREFILLKYEVFGTVVIWLVKGGWEWVMGHGLLMLVWALNQVGKAVGSVGGCTHLISSTP